MNFHRKPSANDIALEKAIGVALSELASHHAETDEYRNVVNQLTALYAIQDTKKDSVSKDALVAAAASLLGIVAIVGHERAHVVTSKALLFVKHLGR